MYNTYTTDHQSHDLGMYQVTTKFIPTVFRIAYSLISTIPEVRTTLTQKKSGLLTAHDPVRGSARPAEVWKPGRVKGWFSITQWVEPGRVKSRSKPHGSSQEALNHHGSGRVGSGRVGSGRVGSGHPGPRSSPLEAIRPVTSPENVHPYRCARRPRYVIAHQKRRTEQKKRKSTFLRRPNCDALRHSYLRQRYVGLARKHRRRHEVLRHEFGFQDLQPGGRRTATKKMSTFCARIHPTVQFWSAHYLFVVRGRTLVVYFSLGM